MEDLIKMGHVQGAIGHRDRNSQRNRQLRATGVWLPRGMICDMGKAPESAIGSALVPKLQSKSASPQRALDMRAGQSGTSEGRRCAG